MNGHLRTSCLVVLHFIESVKVYTKLQPPVKPYQTRHKASDIPFLELNPESMVLNRACLTTGASVCVVEMGVVVAQLIEEIL